VRHGKTPVLTEEEARRLLESLDTSTLVGLRDRALIGVMTYAFARIGGRRHEGRGLLPRRQTLVGAAARERRQAMRCRCTIGLGGTRPACSKSASRRS
jgi:hypothetical protein